MEKISTLKCLIIERLSHLSNEELQLSNYLKDIYKEISSLHLKRLVVDNYERSKVYAVSLQTILLEMDHELMVEPCQIMKELIEASKTLFNKCEYHEVGDVAIIETIQIMKYHLLAGYQASYSYAQALGLITATTVIKSILEEETRQQEELSRLARENIIKKASETLML